ncbi:unnamed protein product [Effrenium voratum]|nr:unnamed protein product [Effrenium voratum]
MSRTPFLVCRCEWWEKPGHELDGDLAESICQSETVWTSEGEKSKNDTVCTQPTTEKEPRHVRSSRGESDKCLPLPSSLASARPSRATATHGRGSTQRQGPRQTQSTLSDEQDLQGCFEEAEDEEKQETSALMSYRQRGSSYEVQTGTFEWECPFCPFVARGKIVVAIHKQRSNHHACHRRQQSSGRVSAQTGLIAELAADKEFGWKCPLSTSSSPPGS